MSRSARSYVVRRWTGLWSLGGTVGTVIAVGVVLGVLQHRLLVDLVTVVVALVVGWRGLAGATTALRADRRGVTFHDARLGVGPGAGGRRVPWSSVHEVAVVEGESVTVRLRADAPMPGWVTFRVADRPGDPDNMVEVRGAAPGVRLARLRGISELFAPDVLVRPQVGKTPPG